MTAKRSIMVRLSVEEADRALRQMAAFGEGGERALQRVSSAAAPASRSLQLVDRSVSSLGEGMRGFAARGGAAASLLSGLGPAGLAAAAGIGGAVVAFRGLDRAVAQADGLQKFADRIGVSVEALQELRFAAERSGVAAQNLDTGLQRFTRRLAEAQVGTGELKGVLEQYGIALRSADGTNRQALDVFGELADVVSTVGDEQEQLRIAVKAFDQEGAGLVNLLRRGSDGMSDLRDRARELGIVLSEDTTREAERARDALDTFGEVIAINVNRTLLALAPAAAAATEALADFFGVLRNEGAEEPAVRTVATLNEELDRATAELARLEAAQAKAQAASRELNNETTSTADAVAMLQGGASEAAVETDNYTAAIAALREELAGLQAQQAAAAAGENDFAISGDLGISGATFRQASEALAELRGELDETVAIETERREKMEELLQVMETLQLSETDRAELIDLLNRKYDEKIERLDKATEATARETEADRAAARAKRELETEVRRVDRGIDRLVGSYSEVDRAAIEYRDTVQLLNDALRLGVIDEIDHSNMLDRAAEAYDKASASAARYGQTVTVANAAASTVDSSGLIGGIARSAGGQLVSGATGGGFDIGGLLVDAASRGGNFVIDALLDGNGIGSILSNVGSNLVSGLTGVTNALSSGLATLAPELGVTIANALGLSAPVGLGGFGTAGAAASNSALAAAGFSAALPGIGIALAGLALIGSKIFGPGKSSGPAIGSSFEIGADGAVGVRSVGADNGANVEDAQQIADAVSELINGVLGQLNATLLPGAFGGEIGYANGRFATAISSPGIAPGDLTSGRSPDLRTFGTIDAAAGDFVVRSLLDAIERGLVEGLEQGTRELLESVLGRVEADGGATADTAAAALDFALSFEDTVNAMSTAGDAAASQLLALSEAAEEAGRAQADQVSTFIENAEKFFGPVNRARGGIDGAGRVNVEDADTFTDENGNPGFVLNGDRYVFSPGRGGDNGDGFGFVNETTGEVVIERTVRRALERLAAGGVRADGSEGFTLDPGDPDQLASARNAAASYVDALLGLGDTDTEPLTGFALQLQTGLERIENLRGAVEALGLSAEEVDAKLASASAELRETTAAEFDQAIADQTLALTDPDALAMRRMLDGLADLRGQATAVGGDLGQVDALFNLRLVAMGRQEEVAAINATLSAREAEASTIEGTIDRLGQLRDAVRRTRENLAISSTLSPLSPVETLAEARGLFDQAVADAQGGDADAAGRANELASRVLELGRDVFASSEDYARLFEDVDGSLGSVEASIESELSVQRDQLTELRSIRDTLEAELSGLADGVGGAASSSPSLSIEGLRQLSDGQYVNSAGYDFGRNPAAALAINEALIAAGLEPISGFGEGQANARRASDSQVDAIIRSLGYEAGGQHAGGFRFVGEGGVELENTGAARITPHTQTLEIFEAAGASAGMTSALLERLVEGQEVMARELGRAMRTIEGLVASQAGGRLGFNGGRG